MAYPQPPAPPRPKPPPSMRRIGLVVAVGAAFVALVGVAAAVAPTDTPPPSTTTTAGTTPTTVVAGSVLASIAALTDCSALQAAFDQADANHDPALARGNQAAAERTVDLMKAADARMQQLGCR